MNNRLLSILLFKQISYFLLVGFSAALTHFSIVIFLVKFYDLPPLVANVFAFLTSFQVSYFGHRKFTFSHTSSLHRVALPKLLCVQVLNFLANESLFYGFLKLSIPYPYALLIVLTILPFFTFVSSKWWVFQS